MTTTLKLLGTPKLLLADAALSLERKTAAVLAYLALEGATQKYKLAGMLWPQSGEHAARNNMRQLLRRLRLQAELITGDDLIELRPELEVDVRHLSSLVSPSLALLKEGGDLLEGLDYDDAPDLAAWLEICREDLLRQRVYLAKAEAQRLEQGGNFRQALDYAQVWLKLEPLTEEAYVQLARLQYFLGDKQGALICLRRCLNLLTDELGAEPQDATLALLHMIERGESPSKKVTTAPTIPASILRPPMLVGREAHWAEMERAWTEGKLIFLSGEAGSGKSRLAADFLASKGAFITEQARPGDIHVPYASHTRFLRGYLQRYPSYSLPGWVQQALSPWLPELETSTTPQANQLRFADASLELMRQIGQHGEALLIATVRPRTLVLEPDEQATEVIAVLVDAVVQLLHPRLLEVADHLLLQLSAALARNDLQHGDPTVHAESHRLIQGPVDLVALVEDVVQVELVFGHGSQKRPYLPP